jgi:hypothetical protein
LKKFSIIIDGIVWKQMQMLILHLSARAILGYTSEEWLASGIPSGLISIMKTKDYVINFVL